MTRSVTEVLVEDFRNNEDGKNETYDSEDKHINVGGCPIHSDSYTEPVGRNNGAAAPNTGVHNPMWAGM